MARNSRELAKGPAIDPEDEPGQEWGWHGSFPRGVAVAGVLSIITLVAIMIGPYQSRTQDLWIIGIVLVVVFGLVRQIIRRRNAWRR